MKSTYLLGLLICLIAAGGCKRKSDVPVEAKPVKVAVCVIGQDGDSATGAVPYSGTVESSNSTTVSFAVAGTIETLSASEGQRVAQGQVLGKLKSGDYLNAKNIADAQLAEAQDGYARLKKLHDANALPEIKWVEMQQKLKQAQNAADIAARAFDETILKAPISGVISRKLADRGQNVAPIEPVFEIVSTDALTINVSVPENEIAQFTVGQSAVIVFNGLEPINGRVSQKSVVADPLTRTYKVKVAFPSSNTNILPGMVGSVTFENLDASPAPMAVSLPSQAVNLSDDNQTFVWLVKNGVAQRRFVSTNELVANGVLVTDGLEPGDTVIVAGMQKVGSGSKVDITLFNKN